MQKLYSTDREKDRLAEKCQYGGGKGLPNEMLHPAGPLPSDLRAEAAERARVAKEWRKRRGEPEPVPGAPPPKPDLRTERVELITNEISDRQQFLEGMRAAGLQNETTRRVEHEIACRKHELERAAKEVK